MTSILWRRIDRIGMERCELVADGDGHRLAGTTLLTSDNGPVEIRYSIALDAMWRTRIVGVHVRAPSDNRSVALRSDGEGRWEVGGKRVADLDGAVDVDLAWTPATNTLPIRRLGLAIGEAGATTAAFVPYPQRQVAARAQTYERLAECRYRYSSGDFTADLTVEEHGLVTTYPGLWTAVREP